MVSQKDELIREFQNVLKFKDEEYVKSLKRWAEEIDTLLSAMTDRFRDQQKQYEQETKQIEAIFRQERAELIDSNRAEMETLMDKRRNMEQTHMEERQKRIERNQHLLQRNQQKDSEEFCIQKNKLETEIQKLEQQVSAFKFMRLQ